MASALRYFIVIIRAKKAALLFSEKVKSSSGLCSHYIEYNRNPSFAGVNTYPSLEI